MLCVVGPNTFCPITWICKKQGAVSHSSTEAEIIAMDAAMRLEGLPALCLWDLVIDVFSTTPRSNSSADKSQNAKLPKQQTDEALHTMDDVHFNTELPLDYEQLHTVDYVPGNCIVPEMRAEMIIMEDNDAVVKMCIKGRSPALRHVPRTHRVDLDWLFERILKDFKGF